ncbi:hypothetical protein SNEBB_011222 [Seison nebaliae]|nr:hypothetical protein SNEBB_011222 [Seison nebaliae]
MMKEPMMGMEEQRHMINDRNYQSYRSQRSLRELVLNGFKTDSIREEDFSTDCLSDLIGSIGDDTENHSDLLHSNLFVPNNISPSPPYCENENPLTKESLNPMLSSISPMSRSDSLIYTPIVSSDEKTPSSTTASSTGTLSITATSPIGKKENERFSEDNSPQATHSYNMKNNVLRLSNNNNNNNSIIGTINGQNHRNNYNNHRNHNNSDRFVEREKTDRQYNHDYYDRSTKVIYYSNKSSYNNYSKMKDYQSNSELESDYESEMIKTRNSYRHPYNTHHYERKQQKIPRYEITSLNNDDDDEDDYSIDQFRPRKRKNESTDDSIDNHSLSNKRHAMLQESANVARFGNQVIPKDSPDYRMKRERNNEAVKRSRAKQKESQNRTKIELDNAKKEIEELKYRNKCLLHKIEIYQKKLGKYSFRSR